MRLIRTMAMLVAVCVLVPGGVASGQDQVRRLTLAEALQAFSENSVALRIARSESEEATWVARQLRAYANPAFSLVREDLGHSGQDYWETTAGVVQRVEWPGRTSARTRVADHAIGAAAARLRADAIRLAFEVREAYARAWFAEQAEEVVGTATSVIRTVAEAAAHRLEAGDISEYEARRLHIERGRAERELADRALQARSARRSLGALITAEAEAMEVGPAAPIEGLPPVVTAEQAREAFSGRPDLEAAARDLDAARARSAVASTEWVPDPTLSLGYKDQADGFSGAAMTLNLPLPVFDRGAGTRQGAITRESTAAYRLDLSRRLAELDLGSTLDRYVSARSRLEGGGDALLADAQALLATARTAYAEGEMTLLELLDAAGAFQDTRLSALSLRSAAWVAYYDMLRAMGDSSEGGN